MVHDFTPTFGCSNAVVLSFAMLTKSQYTFYGTNYTMTGDFNSAFKSGVITIASAGISNAIGTSYAQDGNLFKLYFAHGMTQGATTAFSGGNFGAGFIRGIITKGASLWSSVHFGGEGMVVERTMMASLAGGLSAHATGDDFVQGAFYSSIAHLMNQEEKLRRKRSFWEALKEGGSAKVGLGVGKYLSVKGGPAKMGMGFVLGSGGISFEPEGVDIWGKSTANIEASFLGYSGKYYLWNIDINSNNIPRINTFAFTEPKLDLYTYSIKFTYTPYSFSFQYDFRSIADYLDSKNIYHHEYYFVP